MTIKIFTAKKIITMNPSWPDGTAVAVRDGRILEVGSMKSLEPWLTRDEHEIVDLGDAIVLPGLIDPHLHPVMAAVLLPMHFVTALEWDLPWQTVPACPDQESYRQKIAELEAEMVGDEPFFSWGFHASWHGDMSREVLDAISTTRPMVVWHRSFHEVYLNSAMLELLEITQEGVGARQQIDFERGHFYEVGLGYAIQKLNRFIMSDEWILKGLDRLKQIVHLGGHTTVGDLAVGLFDYELESALSVSVLDQANVPFRVLGVPHAGSAARLKGGHKEVIAHINELQGSDTSRIRHGKHIKVFTDGAFFSELAMLQEPGYLDGHHGEWLMAPEEYEATVREYWQAEFAIHVHCTGDLGLELAIDTLEKMQREKPRFDHGYTIEHFGFSNPEQVARLGKLGAMISANVYYLFELSEQYATQSVGFERAYTMSRLRTSVAHDIPLALHSDFPMAPATPLRNAWIACSRRNAAGNIAGIEESVSVLDALRAITIDAATVLGMQDEVGSIRAGKIADFTVIDCDPIEEGKDALRDANVLATVFEGELFVLD